ncbi:AAA family ATPase [Parabacteroides sp.]|uniref:AAA family ATPase n=1 Tax=Parabacteroides sp. TaxID=1869337 RepID=UPI00257F6AB2|nr:AAA family ATPase [Parabacteroides sp.]
MDSLNVKNFGPIKDVNVSLGDLTLLIGPQASGKSLFLELFKLVNDHAHILSTLRKYNYILSKTDTKPVLENYFGEGLSSLFTPETAIEYNGEPFNISRRLLSNGLSKENQKSEESVFYIPAQRILSISDGRAKNFMEFDISTPYVLRMFSETLRVFVQSGLGNPDTIFPMRTRLKGKLKASINETIFHDARVIIDQSSGQRKMKLQVGNMSLPFMTWSAGQKEFMPLLLAIYCLSGPPTPVLKKENYKWVIIEEPEMGLHPRAIETVILEIIELIQSEYKVIVSTHSPALLEFAWAFKNLQQGCRGHFKQAMCELFAVSGRSSAASLFDQLEKKRINTFYFSAKKQEGVVSSDITSLDVSSDNLDISEWGGLSSFASRVSEIVSNYGE